jgi:rhodanese-related sulfurtransferase
MREIDIDQLDNRLQQGATLVDVREAGEYAQAHVPAARLIPMGQVPAQLGVLDRGRPVYVICATGNRSAVTCELLATAGFEAVNVTGGLVAWMRSGRPVETGL